MPDKLQLVMLPAIPCDARFYASQIDGVSDLVQPQVMVFESPDIKTNAASVLSAAAPRFLLAGTAYGGCLALEIAITAPHRIAGLWLMNCNPGANPDPIEVLHTCSRIRSGGLEEVLADWAGVIVDQEKSGAREKFLAMAREAGPDRFANQYEASARRQDQWENLAAITAPTLLLWGKDDMFVPAAIGRLVAKKIPTARLVELAQCRHFPTLECPEAATELARAWILSCIAATGSCHAAS